MTKAAPDKPQPPPADHLTIADVPGYSGKPDWADEPPMTVRRGGLSWPTRESTWVAPPDMLGVDGKPLVEPTPEHPLPPGIWVRRDGPPVEPYDSAMRMEPETPPALHPLIRAIDRAFTPGPEREPEKTTPGELPGWAAELQYWWTSTASSDIGGSIEKIALYGGRGAAYDLIATGHDLAALNGRTVGDEEATELAILFYVSSKLNRLMAAAIDGRRGSDDTILDSVYYLMMMRRNRAVGGWPVKP